jgi:hypothetical protein
MTDKKNELPQRRSERKRKPYVKPEIVHELALETRAGSPLADPLNNDPLDLTGLGTNP